MTVICDRCETVLAELPNVRTKQQVINDLLNAHTCPKGTK